MSTLFAVLFLRYPFRYYTLTEVRRAVILPHMATITITGYLCDRCGHQWVPRGDPEQKPLVCPKCKSPYWNVPRKNKKKRDGEAAKVEQHG